MKKYSINKARLMTRAWQIAKTLTGDIAARLSLALRTAWQETKAAFLLLSIGGKAWKHPESGDIRIYLNKASEELLEVEKDFYKTGRIITNRWSDSDTAATVKAALAEAIAARM